MKCIPPVAVLFFFAVQLVSICALRAQITGPEQDCIGSIPVCASTFVQNQSYQGIGDIEEIDFSSCLENGENNAVWYVFNITVSGVLELSIIPQDSTTDYDFALYNLTGHTCAEIDSSLEVRCNYAFTQGTTGLQTGYPLTHAGPGDDAFLAPLNVTAGETYALLVDNFSATNGSGYTLDFAPSANSTASIIDSTPPQIDSIIAPSCSQPTSLYVVFSKPMRCSSLQNNFSITGPTVVTVGDTNCHTFSSMIELHLSSPLNAGEVYTLHFDPAGNGTAIEDGCGNMITTAPQTFSITSPPWVSADFTYTCSGRDFTFTNLSQGDSLTYYWTFGDGADTTSEHASHSYSTANNYTVTLVAQNAVCADTGSLHVAALDTFIADFTYSPNPVTTQTNTNFIATTAHSNSSSWTIDGGSWFIANSFSHVFDTTGAHEVCLTSFSTCHSDSICKIINVLPFTSVNTLDDAAFIEVFPNPVTGVAYIRLHDNADATAEAMLYNMLGEKVLIQTFTSKTPELDMTRFPSGIYLLKIEVQGGVGVKEIVKL